MDEEVLGANEIDIIRKTLNRYDNSDAILRKALQVLFNEHKLQHAMNENKLHFKVMKNDPR